MGIWQRYIVVVLLIFVTGVECVLAQSVGSVQRIDKNYKQMVIKLSSLESVYLLPGDHIVLNFGDQAECIVKVKDVKEKLAYTGPIDCNMRDQIRIGQGVEKSLLNESQTSPAKASGEQPNEEVDHSTGLPTINESWYTLWGFGLAGTTYNSELQQPLDDIESNPNVNRTTLGLDLFGFYWPLSGHKTMMGFVVSAVGDNYNWTNGSLQVNQYLYGFSTHHFFGKNIGDGWFVRGDVGIAKYLLLVTDTSFSYGTESESGFGMLVGGGYGFPLGKQTRLLVTLKLSKLKAEDTDSTATSLVAGFLF